MGKSGKSSDAPNRRSKKGRQGLNYSSSQERLFASRLLSQYGMVVKPVADDGNCMFGSISDQLFGECDENIQPTVGQAEERKGGHLYVRERVIRHIREHEAHFSMFWDEDNEDGDNSFEAYINRMSNSGEWGDNLELCAACEVFNIRIVVHLSKDEGGRYILEPSSCRFNGEIHISYHGECHYNSVRRSEEAESKLCAVIGRTPAPDDDAIIMTASTTTSALVALIENTKKEVCTGQTITTFKQKKKAEILARKAVREATGLSKKELKNWTKRMKLEEEERERKASLRAAATTGGVVANDKPRKCEHGHDMKI